jgi:phospholipid/cholesterol/gamma-HCH transport system ATP-binding protein
MDIFDNIAFPLREHTKRSEREIKALVLEKAEMVGMVAHLKKVPGEISGGMRKRAGLARALILDPDIVFFDEPDSGLDPVRVAYLDELVKSVQQETGCTFFIITHNIESVKRTADYIGMLYRSSLVRFGPAHDMFVSDRALVKQFLAGSSVGPIGMDEMVDAARGEADVAALLEEGDADGAASTAAYSPVAQAIPVPPPPNAWAEAQAEAQAEPETAPVQPGMVGFGDAAGEVEEDPNDPWAVPREADGAATLDPAEQKRLAEEEARYDEAGLEGEEPSGAAG